MFGRKCSNTDAQDSADVLEFLGLAGLGQAEARSLMRADVDLDAGRIITFRHKTSTGFAVPIFSQLQPLIERLCRGKASGDKIFKIADATIRPEHSERMAALMVVVRKGPTRTLGIAASAHA
jgi:integrase